MAWQDVATSRAGGLAPAVIAALSNVNPNYDWSEAINQAADASDATWGRGAWQDPGRGSPSAFASGVIGAVNRMDPTSSYMGPAVTALQAKGQQEAASIQAEQATHGGGGLFGGGIGGILGGLALGALTGGIGGLFAGGIDLAGEAAALGISDLGAAGIGAGAAGAGAGFDLFSPSTWSNQFSGLFSQGGGADAAWGVNQAAESAGTGTLGELAGGSLPPVATGMAGGAGQGLGAGAADWWTGMGLTAADVGAGAVPASGAAGGLFSGIPLSTLMGLGSGVSSLIGASAAQRAAQQQAGAANQATGAQLGMFNTLNQQGAPYRAAGYGALGPLTAGIGLGPAAGGVDTGQFTHQFNAADLNSNLAPNYEFMKQQGLGATQNLLNASGGSLSGNTLQGLTKFGVDYAGTGYQNAFNNYTTNQNNIFGRLSQIAGLGTAANQQSAGAGASISPGISQSIQTGGGALASGTVGAANAMTGGINNALGWYALPQLLSKNFGQ